MTKADLVVIISRQTGIERGVVLKVVESFMSNVKGSLLQKENVYLRGFGGFITKKRAQKKARNISKGQTIILPEHHVPTFKPSKEFIQQVKEQLK